MSDMMIDRLVEDLTPVKPLKNRNGFALTLAMAAIVAALVVMIAGIRGDILMGMPHPMFFLRGGVLLLLGLTSSYAVIAMSQPAVGNSFKGWIWALAAALLFPATAAVMAVIARPDDMAILVPRYGMECLGVSMLAGLGIAAAQVLWLRRGAPVALERAGWLVGMSSGALGAAAYSLHCPFNSIFYVGLWYSLAVALCAIGGRLLVPRLIRW
ncbi:RNA polymerase subunit sigma [Sphingorhabdus sp. SMR4y]|nr:RNA polymerase subunit sigma [Sphingorhabdus sp. SMR4y]